MAQEHESHKGELLLQKRRNTPQELIDSIPQYIKSDMPLQHAEFFAALSYSVSYPHLTLPTKA